MHLKEAADTGLFILSSVEVETEAWRSYVTPSGAKSILKPDLMVTLSGEHFDDHWYIEVDLGTESLPVLLGKCRAYEDYRRTGRAQSEHGVFPRVLWILPNRARAERLAAAIADEPKLPDRMFTCIEPGGLVRAIGETP